MPHDLPVTAIAAPVTTGQVHPQGEPVSPPAPAPGPQGHALPNPSLRLDSGLGMVVLEFRDDKGDVTGSIPSQRVLDAYRSHATPVPGAPEEKAAPPDAATAPGRFA